MPPPDPATTLSDTSLLLMVNVPSFAIPAPPRPLPVVTALLDTRRRLASDCRYLRGRHLRGESTHLRWSVRTSRPLTRTKLKDAALIAAAHCQGAQTGPLNRQAVPNSDLSTGQGYESA